MHPEDKKIAEILSDYCRTLHIAKKGRPFGDVANGMREGAPSGGNVDGPDRQQDFSYAVASSSQVIAASLRTWSLNSP